MKTLNLLRWLSIAEGISLLLLVGIAMPLKYAADMPLMVRYTGMAHGMIFIAFVLLLSRALNDTDVSKRCLAWVFGLSFLPLGFLWADRKLKAAEAQLEAASPA